jgi:hypothetical protein
MSVDKGKNKNRMTTKPKGDAPPGMTHRGSQFISNFISGLDGTNRAQHRLNFLYLLENLVGQEVVIRTKDEKITKGIFCTAKVFDSNKPSEIILKLTRSDSKDSVGDMATLIFYLADILCIETSDVLTQAKTGSTAIGELKTDSDIQTHTKLMGAELERLDGRQLASVDSSWLASETRTTLDSGKQKKNSGIGNWDQFEANDRLYNVKTTYDENLYTKRLNLRDFTAEQIEQAERYAREIEGTRSTNIHLQEERGQVMERDVDEEDLYSGVIRPSPVSTTPAAAVKQQHSSQRGTDKGHRSPGGGVDSGNWRRALVGDRISPSSNHSNNAPPPGLKVQKSPSPNTSSPTATTTTTTTTKANGNNKSLRTLTQNKSSDSIASSKMDISITNKESIKDDSPPDYFDEYVPVTPDIPSDVTLGPISPEPPSTQRIRPPTPKHEVEACNGTIDIISTHDKDIHTNTDTDTDTDTIIIKKESELSSSPPLPLHIDTTESKSTESLSKPSFKLNVNAKEFNPGRNFNNIASPKTPTDGSAIAPTPFSPIPTAAYGKFKNNRNEYNALPPAMPPIPGNQYMQRGTNLAIYNQMGGPPPPPPPPPSHPHPSVTGWYEEPIYDQHMAVPQMTVGMTYMSPLAPGYPPQAIYGYPAEIPYPMAGSYTSQLPPMQYGMVPMQYGIQGRGRGQQQQPYMNRGGNNNNYHYSQGNDKMGYNNTTDSVRPRSNSHTSVDGTIKPPAPPPTQPNSQMPK